MLLWVFMFSNDNLFEQCEKLIFNILVIFEGSPVHTGRLPGERRRGLSYRHHSGSSLIACKLLVLRFNSHCIVLSMRNTSIFWAQSDLQKILSLSYLSVASSLSSYRPSKWLVSYGHQCIDFFPCPIRLQYHLVIRYNECSIWPALFRIITYQGTHGGEQINEEMLKIMKWLPNV